MAQTRVAAFFLVPILSGSLVHKAEAFGGPNKPSNCGANSHPFDACSDENCYRREHRKNCLEILSETGVGTNPLSSHSFNLLECYCNRDHYFLEGRDGNCVELLDCAQYCK